MDPKSINDLDPQLRETYNRIMGNTPAGQTPPPPTQTPPPPPQTPPPTVGANPQPRPQSILEPPSTISPFARPNIETGPKFAPSSPPQPQTQTQTPPPLPPLPNRDRNQTVASPSMIPVSGPGPNTYQGPKKERKFPTMLVVVPLVIVFFVVYAVACAKIFGFF